MQKLATFSLSLLALALSNAAFAASQPKTFVYCSEASPSGLNPQLVTDGASIDASGQQIYDRLTTFERGTTHLSVAQLMLFLL